MKPVFKLLKEGRKEEKSAPKFYSRLKRALTYKYKGSISKIQCQEKEHYRILRKIEKELKEKED